MDTRDCARAASDGTHLNGVTAFFFDVHRICARINAPFEPATCSLCCRTRPLLLGYRWLENITAITAGTLLSGFRLAFCL